MDPITMPAATVAVSNGLKAVFKGRTENTCTANKTCAGFCVRDATSTTDSSLCISPYALTGAATRPDPAKTYFCLVTKAVFEHATTSYVTKDAVAYVWIDKAYGAENNLTMAADYGATFASLTHGSAVGYIRFSYWVPKTNASTTATIPPYINGNSTLKSRCVQGGSDIDATNPKIVYGAHTSAE